MKRIIRIEADSNVFSYSSEVPEKKAEGILKWILKSYQTIRSRHIREMEITKLKVTTSVVNPELFT